jgi:hypothetical protein
MGYGTHACAIDIDRLRSVFGSNDRAMLKALDETYADTFRRKDERSADRISKGAPTQREALAQIIRLMRHSSLELSGRYTRPRVVDIENAVGSIPSLRPDAQGHETKAATGTEGRRINDLLAHYLPTGGDGTGRKLSDAGGMDMETPQTLAGRNPLKSEALDASCRSQSGADDRREKAASRTRTEDLLITNELLYQLS